MAERTVKEQRVLVHRGETIRLVFEEGPLLEVTYPRSPNSSFVFEQKPVDSREAKREQLRAGYPGILFPHVQARLNQLGYKTLGEPDEVIAEADLLETRSNLIQWTQKAKSTGISNREVLELSKDLLKTVTLAAPRLGQASAMTRGINTEISDIVKEVWGTGKKNSPGNFGLILGY